MAVGQALWFLGPVEVLGGKGEERGAQQLLPLPLLLRPSYLEAGEIQRPSVVCPVPE